MSRKLTSVLVFFWLALSCAFAAMSIYTYETRSLLRKTLGSAWFDLASNRAKEGFERFGAPPHDYLDQKPEIMKLEPVLNHMLNLERLAFVLTAVSAFVEFISTFGS